MNAYGLATKAPWQLFVEARELPQNCWGSLGIAITVLWHRHHSIGMGTLGGAITVPLKSMAHAMAHHTDCHDAR